MRRRRRRSRRRREKSGEKENDSFRRECTWEHKVLSESDSVPGAISPTGSPWKQGRITIGKELNLERSDFVFDRQPDEFR